MIIYLKGADFSENNIGTLSTYSIRFSGNVTNENTTVDRETNTGYSTTIVLSDGYELNGSITVTMGGEDITSTAVSDLTISIASVTGNVVIKVPTVNTATGEEDGGNEDTGSGGSTGGGNEEQDNNLMDITARLNANTVFASGTSSTTRWGAFRGATPTVDGDCVKIDCSTATNSLAGIRMGVPATVSALATGTKVQVTFSYRHDESYTPVGEYKFYVSSSATSFNYTTEWQQFSKVYTWDGSWDRLQISSATTTQKEAIFYVKDFCIEVVS